MDHTKYIFSKKAMTKTFQGVVCVVSGGYWGVWGGPWGTSGESWVVRGLGVFDQNLSWGCRMANEGCLRGFWECVWGASWGCLGDWEELHTA